MHFTRLVALPPPIATLERVGVGRDEAPSRILAAAGLRHRDTHPESRGVGQELPRL